MNDYNFSLSSDPELADLHFLSQQLEAYNVAQVGYTDAKRLTILVRDLQNQIVGGLTGWTYWGWLAIDVLWVHENARGQGYGTQLLHRAEQEAKARGCQHVLLDTMSFQAPDFYQRQGYDIYGRLEGFAGTHTRYYLRKTLS